MTDLNQITATLSPERLCILGGFHEDGGTVLMIGPDEPGGFWDHFKKSPEANDGQSHGMDRWSERVLGKIAQTLEGEVFFPFVPH